MTAVTHKKNTHRTRAAARTFAPSERGDVFPWVLLCPSELPWKEPDEFIPSVIGLIPRIHDRPDDRVGVHALGGDSEVTGYRTQRPERQGT